VWEQWRCELELPVGLGASAHKSKSEELYTSGDGRGAPTACDVFTWVLDTCRFLELEVPDDVVDERQALGV
jgi:hypothetical protein